MIMEDLFGGAVSDRTGPRPRRESGYMNVDIKQRFKDLGYRLSRWLSTRYGTDRMSRDLLIAGLILSIVSRLLRARLLYSLATVMLIVSVLRTYAPSASWEKRQRELQIYTGLYRKAKNAFKLAKLTLTDRQHKYLMCPSCGKLMRIPRGQGNIVVSCPGCGHQTRTRS